jgi:hypothetical protein
MHALRSFVVAAATALLLIGCASDGSSPPATSSGSVSASSVSPTASAARTAGSSAGPAKEGIWRMLPPAPLESPVDTATAAWDGHELFISARTCNGSPGGFTQTAAYDPATNAWRKLPPHDGPKGCFEGGDTAIWDGRELLLLGITNAAYDPEIDRWRVLPDVGLFARGEVSVWSGRETLGFGGGCCGDYDAMTPSYTPATDSWSHPRNGPLSGRRGVVGVWDGTELLLAGGYREAPDGSLERLSDAAAYDPSGSWRRLAAMPATKSGAPPWGGTAVWDGAEMLVVNGSGALAFDPSKDRWRRLPAMAYPRQGAVAVWTGDQMLVWGGGTTASGGKEPPPHGEAFDPSVNRWSAMPASPLRHRYPAVAVWTGREMIVWGGHSLVGQRVFSDGAAYVPAVG